MERQTLQQEAPVYHVCQECGGDGCEACSDLCILDGDIHLDPELDEESYISFDDRNMYQRREDDLRLAGDWEA